MTSLSQIVIYPVKSCRGVSVPQARLTDRGLEGDRRFMVVDPEGEFLTQRKHPEMARISTAFEGADLVMRHAGSSVHVPREPTGPVHPVRVWRSVVGAVDCGDQAADWFSAHLSTPARLVFMPESTARTMNPDYARPDQRVSFADGYPYLLTLEQSLADLNARLSEPVGMDRFRPNLVVRGGSPWDEDGYDRLSIGEIAFRATKPCARCVMVTTDQDTGKVTSKEPLRTLAGFRTQELGVIFGQNLVAEATSGILRVGDALTSRGRSSSLP